MDFSVKDFEDLHRFKIRFTLEDKYINQDYFFCLLDKMIFIKKSRAYFQIAASCQCGFEPVFTTSVFDILYQSKDLSDVIVMYKSYCMRLLENELH